MTEPGALELVREALEEVCSLMGVEAGRVDSSFRPWTDLSGFDSLIAVEVLTLLEISLDQELNLDHGVFGSPREPASVADIARTLQDSL